MSWSLVLSCEHAGHAVPEGVWLGVDEAGLLSHCSWDPGALEAAQRIAAATGAPLVSGQFTRVFVDLNRSPGAPGVTPEVSFGLPVPGNQGLSAEDKAARIAKYHAPFRARLRTLVDEGLSRTGRVLHLSMHSFTPVMNGQVRPYHLGALFHTERSEESRWADRILASWRAAGFDARPNLPYPGTSDGSTTWLRTLHPDALYAGLEIELSQALDEEASATAVDALLAAVFEGGA